MDATHELTSPAQETATTKRKLLLVDNDPAFRHILARLLLEEDFNALAAASGKEALALGETTPIDLTLLSLDMPAKNGWETFAELAIRNPLVPIILITGQPNQLFPAVAAGACALVEKPLDFSKLFKLIHKLLDKAEDLRLARLTGRSYGFSYVRGITSSFPSR